MPYKLNYFEFVYFKNINNVKSGLMGNGKRLGKSRKKRK